MKYRTLNFVLLIVIGLGTLFFSNNFGLVDIERTAVITAIGVDLTAENEYELTAQIAVPEATDTNTENNKTQISATGGTAGAALKKLANISGWFPNLSYCNLIILGNDLVNENVVKILDYFLTTFRLQDSALIAMAEGTAKELLTISSPLDNISSFAIQKIIIKNKGFENNVVVNDIKNFCTGYYGVAKSSFMPIISTISPDDNKTGSPGSDIAGENNQDISIPTASNQSGSSGGAGGSESSSGTTDLGSNPQQLFSADRTALFKNGIKVGELDADLSFIFNIFKENMKGATFELKNVSTGGEPINYLLTVFNNDAKIKITADENNLEYFFNIELFCKISDQSSANAKNNLSSNQPLPDHVKDEATKFIEDRLDELIKTIEQTECDFLNLYEQLYQKHYKQYARYKDSYILASSKSFKIKVSGPAI